MKIRLGKILQGIIKQGEANKALSGAIKGRNVTSTAIKNSAANLTPAKKELVEKYLQTKQHGKITADLFIDCTGFKSLLLGEALKEPFESYEDILINNSAWAARKPYTDKVKEMKNYTNCTAIENGWVWEIPLWNRMGTGYVYSDKFVSD